MISNPDYKGKWKAPMIDNPSYKGEWKPERIANPGFFEDLEPFRMTPIVSRPIMSRFEQLKICAFDISIYLQSYFVQNSSREWDL